MKKWVKYLRVSTKVSQGIDGLGIAAQSDSVSNYVQRVGGDVIGEFIEAESGTINDRPQLMAALALCKKHKATLLTARLDRISRDSCFLISLKKSEVEFCCVDMPEADRFSVSLFAILSERERDQISLRTRLALQAAKRRGVKLGNPHHEESVKLMVAGSKAAKVRFQEKMKPMIEEIKKTAGISTLQGIADCLNRRGILTRTGKTWHPTTVRLVTA